MIRYLFSVVFACCLLSCTGEVPTNGKAIVYKDMASGTVTSVPPVHPIISHLEELGFVDIQKADNTIFVDLKYATSDNFTGKILYNGLNRAYLHPLAMEKLSKAAKLLKESYPDLNLLVYDAARPLSVQKDMYEEVKNTKYRAYVADPSRTGLHNYGMAVDLTLCDNQKNPLDMGTKFDYFGKEAGINNEDLFISQGLLTQQQVNNRRILRNTMQQAGFIAIRGEWWHFNALPLGEAKRVSKLIE